MRQYGEDIAAPVGNQPANSECQHDPNLLWSPSTRPVNQQYQGGAECPILRVCSTIKNTTTANWATLPNPVKYPTVLLPPQTFFFMQTPPSTCQGEFTQGKKDPQQDHQVHDQEDAADPGR